MLLSKVILVLLCILLFANNAFAFSNCQSKYDSDKRSLQSLRGNCSICHLNNPSGGGPRTEFGNAFAEAGFKITDALVAQFPNLFQKSQDASTEPVIRRVKPKSVKTNVQTMLSVMGQNFVTGSKAFIDNNEVLTTFKSNMLLIIDFVLDTVGLHNLKVENPDGQKSNTVKVKAK